MHRNINLRQIEAFKAVIESGTVSRAADMVNISQPAMSKLLTNLELDTGLKLFDRKKGRLAPTERAMRLYDEIGRIFAGVRQIENAVDSLRREDQGRLAIGVLPALSGPFIQRSTSKFLAKHRNVYCDVESTTSQWIVDRLIGRKMDIGLVNSVVDNPYVVREPLLRHPLVCIMPVGHALSHKSAIEPQDLDEVPYIAFPDSDIGLLVDKMFDAYRVRCNKVLVSNVAPTLCEFVAAGLGVSLVHPLVVSGLEQRLTVRPFSPEIPYNFLLCRRLDSRNSQLVDAFAHEVLTTAQQLSEFLR